MSVKHLMTTAALAACLTTTCLTTPLWAKSSALVIGNAQYGTWQTLLGAARVGDAGAQLEARGVSVWRVQDATSEDMSDAFEGFVIGLQDSAGPVVVALSGVFMHGPQGAYLVPVDEAEQINEARVLTDGLPLDAVLAVLAQYPGRALLLLGETTADPQGTRYLQPGVGQLDIPQGVAVLRGPASDVARFAVNDLPMAQPLRAAARRHELTVEGFVPDTLVLIGPDDLPESGEATAPEPKVDHSADHAAWAQAQQGDSLDSYETYAQAYPEGQHAQAAAQRIKAIRSEPFYHQRRAEEALNLNREARRAIQRDLPILGHATRGIDGIFGSGTRAGITAWQASAQQEASGYLTDAQIASLADAAKLRNAELEAEAKRQAEERKQREAQAWARARARADEKSLRAYVSEFPEGANVAQARRLLKQLDDERAQQAAAHDRAAWQEARAQNTIPAYRWYLKNAPRGAFRGEAQTRISDMQHQINKDRGAQRARNEEQALSLPRTARQLAEIRLKQLGFPAGPADGDFTRQTRAAIEDFQRTRNLRVSGFLDDQTVLRLLADGIAR
jgi:peptidoglycan hydrolase-like protein with peptidoglycan-binding domain